LARKLSGCARPQTEQQKYFMYLEFPMPLWKPCLTQSSQILLPVTLERNIFDATGASGVGFPLAFSSHRVAYSVALAKATCASEARASGLAKGAFGEAFFTMKRTQSS